ncbi:leucine-rich repeat domain-containing protein [Peptostreptococcaceae bacterium AGR-M142]
MKNIIKNLALVLVFSLLFTSNSSAYYMNKLNYFAIIEYYDGSEFEIDFFNDVLNTKENISSNNIYITDKNFNKLNDLTGMEFEEYKEDTIGSLMVYLDNVKLESDKIYYLVVDKNILLENKEKLGVDIKKPFKVNALYNEFIKIKDKDLEYAIKEELGGIDKITKGDLKDVDWLSLSDFKKFSNLKEILLLENLNYLEFENVDFSNWDDLDYALLNQLNDNLGSLRLSLASCKIKDFDLIQKNLNIYSLDIDNCQIDDIKGISNLKELESIDFINCDLKAFDLEEDFSKLNYLTTLTMENCDFKNLKFLKDFDKLEDLTIINSNFSLDDLDIVFENKNMLRKLIIANSNIDNIDFLKRSNGLEYLEVYGNKIKEISVLENMKDLSILDISGNKITNIDVLKNLNIGSLDIGYNEIKDFSVLENIIDLDQLGVSKEQIEIIKANINLNKDIYIDVY